MAGDNSEPGDGDGPKLRIGGEGDGFTECEIGVDPAVDDFRCTSFFG